jgi:hypothetical protein
MVPLIYLLTVIGGVQPRERWDFLECPHCGLFEYRYRSRSIRPVKDLPAPAPTADMDLA